MFGNVISVSDLTIKLENISKRVETSLLGVHIVFENKYKIVAEITSITREEIASFVDMNISVKNMCQLLNMNYIKFNDSLLDDLKRRLSIIEEAQNKLLKIIDDLYEKEVKNKL